MRERDREEEKREFGRRMSRVNSRALCHTPEKKTEKTQWLVLVYDSQNENARGRETQVSGYVCPTWQ